MNDAKPLILTSPDEIVRLLQPHLEVKPTMFSTLVGKGDIPHVPIGRTQKFRVSDLDKFQGYDPKAEKQRAFQQELEKIANKSRRRK